MYDEWLKTQFKLNPDKSKADLARALNLDPPAISKILNGMRQIKAHEYVEMRKFFGLPVDGERATETSANNYVLSPLNKEVRDSISSDEEAWVVPASLLAGKTKATPEQIKIFEVTDNSMNPDFMPGEFVLIDLSDQNISRSGFFVVSNGIDNILRQGEYVPHSTPAQVKFSAANKSYDPFTVEMDKAEITGRVIAKLEWL